MSKRRKRKKNNNTLLNLNNLPIPDEIVKLMISFLPTKWPVPRIPKKMNSKLYSLRSLYVNNGNQMFDINTSVKIKQSIYKKFHNVCKYLVPPDLHATGTIIGYVSPESYIDDKVDKLWQIKDAKPYKGVILYKVLFRHRHNKYGGPCHRIWDKTDKEVMPYQFCSSVKLAEIAIKHNIYYLYPDEVKYYIDIEDREVRITKKNKVMFDKSGI
tara:strand:+ start:447 stop:1085 length:639 start_codon:yes stop_codon:yes gene_type:complete